MGIGPGRQLVAAPATTVALSAAAEGRPVSLSSGHPLAIVDADRCTGCGICIEACPEKAISVNRVAAVEPGLCVGCGECVPECPNEALALDRVPLGRGATG